MEKITDISAIKLDNLNDLKRKQCRNGIIKLSHDKQINGDLQWEETKSSRDFEKIEEK